MCMRDKIPPHISCTFPIWEHLLVVLLPDLLSSNLLLHVVMLVIRVARFEHRWFERFGGSTGLGTFYCEPVLDALLPNDHYVDGLVGGAQPINLAVQPRRLYSQEEQSTNICTQQLDMIQQLQLFKQEMGGTVLSEDGILSAWEWYYRTPHAFRHDLAAEGKSAGRASMPLGSTSPGNAQSYSGKCLCDIDCQAYISRLPHVDCWSSTYCGQEKCGMDANPRPLQR